MGAAAALALGLVSGCGYANPYSPGSAAATTVVPSASASAAPSPAMSPTPAPGGDSFTAGAGLRPVEFADGLEYIDLKAGTGATARTGAKVSVQYTGWLSSGKVFDSSWTRGRPFSFTLGQGQVIKGWDEGVVGMKVGGKRKLIIPPGLGYGAKGHPPVIPGGATLTFEVTLLTA
ncbi:MAG: FKBP-type peptidyl-prolyl cis-trans isomerase [Candidatus Dormibacteraceae bacterium]